MSYNNPIDYPYSKSDQFDEKTKDKYNNIMYYDAKKEDDVKNNEYTNKSRYDSYKSPPSKYDKDDKLCGDYKSGRSVNVNSCGQWKYANKEFYGGQIYKHSNDKDCVYLQGALFPIHNNTLVSSNNTFVTSNPQDRVVFGYARIGEEYHSR